MKRITTVLLGACLALIPVLCSGEVLATYRGLVIEAVSPMPSVAGSELEMIATAVTSKFLEDEYKAAKATGKIDSQFTEYKNTQWEQHNSGLQELEQQLIAYKDALTSFTVAAKSGTTDRQFYESLSAEIRERMGLQVFEMWQQYRKVMPTAADVDRQIGTFPRTAEAGHSAYGKPLDLSRFKEQWTIAELRRLRPELADRLSTQSLVEHMKANPQPFTGPAHNVEAKVEQARSELINELALRLIISREFPHIHFEKPETERDFQMVWNNRISRSLGADLIPEGALPGLQTSAD